MPTRRSFLVRLAAAVDALRSVPAKSQGPGDPEYIVVGSGAGGGTVAARLAELGHTVLVLEAGGDPLSLSGGNAIQPQSNTLPEDYNVPAFHPNSTENTAMSWDVFVRHYADDAQQRRDPKYRETAGNDKVDGIFYPRAGTLGGCTAHNALIFVCPHNQDWQDIATAMNDPSWSPDNMREYFVKLENCRHRPFERFLHALTGRNPTRHGFAGWLRTEHARPLETVFQDHQLIKTIKTGFKKAFRAIGNPARQILQGLESLLDPNDWHIVKANAEGVHYTPLTMVDHSRTSTRDRLRDVEQRSAGRLRIETGALVTRVVIDPETRCATGVEYLKGDRLYHPHGEAPGPLPEPLTVNATREVILCGGAFNTPQLLMLSGVGPEDQLTEHHIRPIYILDGVGRNLQDRYEVGVVHRLPSPWKSLEKATFLKDDPAYQDWKKHKGVYTTNGAILGFTRKSDPQRTLPDLFCFGLVGDFRGYEPGYSRRFADEKNMLTWAILKAHTENRGGRVTLKSSDPRVAPAINFHYFEEGTDVKGEDLKAVVEGIKLVRRLTDGLNFEEVVPGNDKKTEDALGQFVRDNAWGHHASCTCPIADEHHGGVLDSNFRVYGIRNLRIVDASIFPRIPGFFIVSSIYIAAEKAADVIHHSPRQVCQKQ